MQTLTSFLVDGSQIVKPVKDCRYNQLWNNVDYTNQDGSSSFIHLHPKQKWENPYRCSEHDATSVFVMNEGGHTVATFRYTDWDNCLKHELQQTDNIPSKE